jgi:hypothetical protein
MAWCPPTPTILVLDLILRSNTKLDSVLRAGKSSNEEIDYAPVGPESEILKFKDSEGDEVQILEPLPIPVNDIDTEDEEEHEPMDTSEDTEGELEV